VEKNQRAPGRLDLIRVFANTWDAETGRDALAELDQAQAWLHTMELPSVARAGLPQLVAFRNAVRAVLEAHDGHGSEIVAWQALEHSIGGIRLCVHVDGAEQLHLAPAPEASCTPVATLVGLVYDAIREGTWSRLKICRASDCAVAFYDYSKNGSGTWCDMAVCGNREKARRRRRKLPAAGSF